MHHAPHPHTATTLRSRPAARANLTAKVGLIAGIEVSALECVLAPPQCVRVVRLAGTLRPRKGAKPPSVSAGGKVKDGAPTLHHQILYALV